MNEVVFVSMGTDGRIAQSSIGDPAAKGCFATRTGADANHRA